MLPSRPVSPRCSQALEFISLPQLRGPLLSQASLLTARCTLTTLQRLSLYPTFSPPHPQFSPGPWPGNAAHHAIHLLTPAERWTAPPLKPVECSHRDSPQFSASGAPPQPPGSARPLSSWAVCRDHHSGGIVCLSVVLGPCVPRHKLQVHGRPTAPNAVPHVNEGPTQITGGEGWKHVCSDGG